MIRVIWVILIIICYLVQKKRTNLTSKWQCLALLHVGPSTCCCWWLYCSYYRCRPVMDEKILVLSAQKSPLHDEKHPHRPPAAAFLLRHLPLLTILVSSHGTWPNWNPPITIVCSWKSSVGTILWCLGSRSVRTSSLEEKKDIDREPGDRSKKLPWEKRMCVWHNIVWEGCRLQVTTLVVRPINTDTSCHY